MHNYKHVMGSVPLRMALATLIVASLLLAMPALSLANNHTDEDRGQGRAFGRAIAIPPLITFLEHWEEELGWLPPGLARLLERYKDHFGDIGDDDDDDDGTDADDPELENVEETVGETTATLQFEFNENVQARLFVSPDADFDNNDDGVIRLSHTNYDEQHEFDLTDLEEETEYFYRVRYRDEDGNAVTSETMSFATEATDDNDDGDDTSDPVIESQDVEVGTTTADLLITFDEPTQVRVFVSPEDGFNTNDEDVMVFEETDLLTDHTIAMDELTSDTEYFFRIRYRDEAGNSVLSEQMSFTTLEDDDADTTGPVVSDVTTEAGTTTITATFTTDEPAMAAIYTATTTEFDLDDDDVIVTEDTTLKTEHELTITGLASSTTYYHVITVEDEAGNTTQSEEFTFGTD